MLKVAALVVAVVTGALPVAATAAEDADEVTIRVREFVDPVLTTRNIELTGTVASRDAGEAVEVLVKECGPNFPNYRVAAGVKTSVGGAWRLATTDVSNQGAVQLPINAYFRARWRGHLSSPVLNSVPPYVFVDWRARTRRATVSVSAANTGQNLRGRVVELQRKVPGTDEWTRVRRARLGRGLYQGFGVRVFAAVFVVQTRGLTLRVLVPAETGAPCFSASVSSTFNS